MSLYVGSVAGFPESVNPRNFHSQKLFCSVRMEPRPWPDPRCCRSLQARLGESCIRVSAVGSDDSENDGKVRLVLGPNPPAYAVAARLTGRARSLKSFSNIRSRRPA